MYMPEQPKICKTAGKLPIGKNGRCVNPPKKAIASKEELVAQVFTFATPKKDERILFWKSSNDLYSGLNQLELDNIMKHGDYTIGSVNDIYENQLYQMKNNNVPVWLYFVNGDDTYFNTKTQAIDHKKNNHLIGNVERATSAAVGHRFHKVIAGYPRKFTSNTEILKFRKKFFDNTD